jgi:putative ABC transport system substrate-binding protein
MKRRAFIALLGGAAAWPVAARAQPPAMPMVGFLHSGSPSQAAGFLAAFRQGLGELGYVEGSNVAIELRWADGNYDRLPALAAELVSRGVAVVATGGGVQSPLAVKSATTTIPVVFSGGSAPVAAGLVASLNRPAGNVTGVLNISAELTAKRLALLRELVPAASRIAVLQNPGHPEADTQTREIEAAAAQLGVTISFAGARHESEFEAALAALMQRQPGALFVGNDPFFATRRHRLVPLIARHAIPAIFSQRQFSEAGGLLSYGADFKEMYRQAGTYVGRILKGEKPSDLPVMQPTKFELVVNLKTAKALRLTIPPTLLALADEVIE